MKKNVQKLLRNNEIKWTKFRTQHNNLYLILDKFRKTCGYVNLTQHSSGLRPQGSIDTPATHLMIMVHLFLNIINMLSCHLRYVPNYVWVQSWVVSLHGWMVSIFIHKVIQIIINSWSYPNWKWHNLVMGGLFYLLKYYLRDHRN